MYYTLKYDVLETEGLHVGGIAIMTGKARCYSIMFHLIDHKHDLLTHLNIKQTSFWVADDTDKMTKALTGIWEKQGYKWYKGDTHNKLVKKTLSGAEAVYHILTWDELVAECCEKWGRWKINQALTT